MYPLRFHPIFRRYIWGGRRLADVLKKPIGDDSCAESWEIVDHNDDQSVVQFGDLAGQTLAGLISESAGQLLGAPTATKISNPELPENLQNRFPLLLKFLDANRALSVQVHPDDVIGRTLDPPDLGKTEAWYVMHADPGAKIYAGLKPGIDRERFAKAIEHGFTEEALHSFEPKAGDCVFIRAGTIHAIGAGLLIAEIQQCSNTTFRVYDWDRVDSDGNSRPLHIEQSLDSTDYEIGPVNPEPARATENDNAVTLAECDKFVMRRWSVGSNGSAATIGSDDSFRILAVTRGSVNVEGDPAGQPLEAGQTMLVPACVGAVDVVGTEPSEVLEIFVPSA